MQNTSLASHSGHNPDRDSHSGTVPFAAPANGAARRKSAAPKRATFIWRLLGGFIFMLFIVGSLFAGYLFYVTTRTFVSALPMQSVSNLPPIGRAQDSSSNGGPSAPASAVDPQQPKIEYQRQERINFLLMGIDLRPGERGAARTDTMIVVTIDPVSKNVGMLSFPRDLWVTVPGYGENRINTAYFTGEADKYPGGGPALAERTIQYNFGIPINYYVVINFVGFRKMVDTLGGLTIDVPQEIYDSAFPDDTYGYRTLYIKAGVQHMSGDLALAYARTRHQDTDFGRMKRQQQVLMAIKQQALTASTVTKIPALWAGREDMVSTDLTLDKIAQFAQLAKDIKSDNITSRVIDESMALGITTPQGAMVLWPDRDKIRAVIAELFKEPEAVAVEVKPQQPSEQIQKLASEAAKIEISNGTPSDGLATRVADWLKSQGFNVVLVDNADRKDYANTVVVESSTKSYTKDRLLNIFHVAADKVRKSPNSKSEIDLRIIIGKDFNEKEIPDSR